MNLLIAMVNTLYHMNIGVYNSIIDVMNKLVLDIHDCASRKRLFSTSKFLRKC